MLSTYKPKSIQVIGFDKYNYDFLKKFRHDLIISIPLIYAQEINYVVDGNGNLVTGDGFYREYNELNQLIRIRESNTSNGKILEEYTWHPTQERILIKDVYYNNTKNYTIYYVSKEYVVIENSTGNYTEEYIYQENVLVAQADTNGNKIAVHPDHEGSSTTFTDSNGNLLETTFYSAYGEILSGGKTSRFDYEGKEFDSVVQDYDFNFRKYKPDPPIFTQPDTLIQNVYDPQSLNRYAFERNNPYKYVDPSGHQAQWILDAVRTVGAGVFIILVALATAFFIWVGISDDPAKDLSEQKALQKAAEDAANQPPPIPIQTQEPKEEFPPIPKSTDGTFVPPEVEIQRQKERQELCERANIDCGEDSRLKLRIDPTIQQDKPVSEKPKEKEEDKPTSSSGKGGASGGAPVGSTACSWWSTCTVKSSTY